MSESPESTSLPLSSDGVPILPGMDEAWQAHLFALTVALNERGLFSWSTWGEYFGPALKVQYPNQAAAVAVGVPSALKGDQAAQSMLRNEASFASDSAVNRHYFLAWQAALEQLLSDMEIALPLDIGMRAQAQACYPRVARAPMVFRALAQSPGKTGPA
jgi:hypothetical protein